MFKLKKKRYFPVMQTRTALSAFMAMISGEVWGWLIAQKVLMMHTGFSTLHHE